MKCHSFEQIDMFLLYEFLPNLACNVKMKRLDRVLISTYVSRDRDLVGGCSLV